MDQGMVLSECNRGIQAPLDVPRGRVPLQRALTCQNVECEYGVTGPTAVAARAQYVDPPVDLAASYSPVPSGREHERTASVHEPWNFIEPVINTVYFIYKVGLAT
jgi:hypothetical protein